MVRAAEKLASIARAQFMTETAVMLVSGVAVVEMIAATLSADKHNRPHEKWKNDLSGISRLRIKNWGNGLVV